MVTHLSWFLMMRHKKATDMAIAAKFRNNGQVCISPNRFYIQESKKDEFVNLFIEKTEN